MSDIKERCLFFSGREILRLSGPAPERNNFFSRFEQLLYFNILVLVMILRGSAIFFRRTYFKCWRSNWYYWCPVHSLKILVKLLH